MQHMAASVDFVTVCVPLRDPFTQNIIRSPGLQPSDSLRNQITFVSLRVRGEGYVGERTGLENVIEGDKIIPAALAQPRVCVVVADQSWEILVSMLSDVVSSVCLWKTYRQTHTDRHPDTCTHSLQYSS
ncbi:hypothetical protein XELAEV_18003544mg [Xenopus laevis]|nr:hypothetical protein XELAEV_18003544mg [Xenopus laevis]